MNLHAAMPRISRMPACAVLVFAAGMASLFGMTSGVTPVLLKPMEGAAVSVLPSDASVRGDITGIAFKDVAEKPTFAKLAGTRAVLSFLRPITLRKIALPRIGWADWALPKTARVSVNGGPATEVTLSAPRISPGKYLPAGALEMDVVDFGKEMEVSEISVEITGAGAERGDNLHGTIRVAIPAPPPTLFGLTASDAVPPTAVGVTFEVECGAPVNEPLFIASARQFRAARALTAPLPSFPQGKSKYTVFWNNLTSDAEFPSPISPRNFYEFGIQGTGGETPDWKITSWSYIKDEARRTSGALEMVAARNHAADAKGWRKGIPEEGFGRFGWIQNSGLLVGSLLADGVANVITTDLNGKPLKTAIWKIECGNATTRVWDRTTAGWTFVRHQALYDYSSEIRDELAVKEPGLLTATRLPRTLTGSILAPGILLDSNDSEISLVLSAPRAENNTEGWILHSAKEGIKKVGLGEMVSGEDMSEGWIVASWAGAEESPMLLAFKKRPKSLTLEGNRLRIQFFGSAERVGVGFPLGYVPPGGIRQLSKAELAERARQMSAILRAYPIQGVQQFREVKGEIEIQEITRHLEWENDWKEPARRVAPLSPLLAFAATQKYPVRLPEPLDTTLGWNTKYGPYEFVSGDTLTYRMAVPSLMTRIYPRVVPMDSLAETVGREISTPIPPAKHPLSSDSIACFKGWASSSLAWPLMPEDRLPAFLSSWHESLDLVFGDQAWYLRREPFSGATYPVSFAWIEPDTATLGDVNSGIGAALYSLDAYAALSGDWSFAREKWPRVQAMLEYFLLEHDWCQMQTGAREHSGSSAIDMDCIGYQGVLAYARMAEKLGKSDDAAYGRFLLARVALPLSMRWLGERWLNATSDLQDVPRLGVGLGENTGFDLMSTKLDPNYVNSQTALMLSWLGQFPEVYDAHIWGAGREFFAGFERSFVEKRLPDWRKPWPGNRNNHAANVSAHLYLRALLGFSSGDLRGELQKQPWGLDPKGEVARENAPLYSLLLAAGSPVILRDWGMAKPIEFQYDTASRTARLRFASPRAEMAVIEPLAPVKQVSVNGQNAIPTTENGLLRLDLPAGEPTVTISFAAAPHSGSAIPLQAANDSKSTQSKTTQ